MDGRNINRSGKAPNQSQTLEDDGAIIREQPQGNAALILFRRVGRAFADLGGVISRAFHNLADSFRGALAHVNNMIHGVDRGIALRHVSDGSAKRGDYSTRYGDLDKDEDSDEEYLDLDSGKALDEKFTVDQKKEEPDFSEMISPTLSQSSTEQASLSEVSESKPAHDLYPIDDDSKIEIETSAADKVIPQKTNGEILFEAFHKLNSDNKSDAFISSGSVYLQPDCLDFAQEIVNHSMAIEFRDNTKFTKEMLQSAKNILSLKRQFEADDQSRIKKEAALEKLKTIEQEKFSMLPGEWDFKEYLEVFSDHQLKGIKFILYEKGLYRSNADLLAFAEKVASDVNASDSKKQAANYLIRWNRYPSHAEKIMNEVDTFSLVPLPPAPPAPPPRVVAAPKLVPIPVPPDQSAIMSLVNADDNHHNQLLSLISLHKATFDSGLVGLSQILNTELSMSNEDKNTILAQLKKSSEKYAAYTDLEEIDNAIHLIQKLSELKTGHKIGLSAAIDGIKAHHEAIINNLKQKRHQIIESRKITDVGDLNGDQIVRGQKLFDNFLHTYIPSRKRNDLDRFLIRDVYFSDECMSYANQIHLSLSQIEVLIDADKESLEAAGYLLNKYNQFKASSVAVNLSSL